MHAMRINVTVLLAALLALCAFASQADEPYAAVAALGKGSCNRLEARPGSLVGNGVPLAELVRVTCELDDMLLAADDARGTALRRGAASAPTD